MGISILGAGNVGMALAGALIRAGESVVFGVPDPARYTDAVAKLGAKARVTDADEAIRLNEIVILAVPHASALDIAERVADWQGKILVDATNPLAPGLAGLTIGTTDSGAEDIARRARSARVVKAFNTTGAENMADARYANGTLMMPVCGDDRAARTRVMDMAASIGFRPLDCGSLAAARYLEPFAMTWIHLAFKQGMGRNFGFALLER
ncbi:MAG TPA: NADPH-dependent F420 reductase [Usitatibacteraceae bacterium]|nr:NADPH-dependent F420 reductase [Usitatibacteraceae bacterium]